MKTNLLITLNVLLIFLCLYLYNQKQECDINTEHQKEILKIDILHLQALSDSLIIYNNKIEANLKEYQESKDSLNLTIKVKDFKIKAIKSKLKNEKIDRILYASDSSIITILSEYEFETASDKR